MQEEPEFFSDVPITKPVLRPSQEIQSFSGFAWTDEVGIVIERGSVDNEPIIEFRRISLDG